MSPEHAKIFLVDDNSSDISNARWILERNGHSIVSISETLTDALEQIPTLKERGVSVAVVDGNLARGVSTGEDGRRITAQIREQFKGEIKVVFYSGGEGSHSNGDVFVPKVNTLVGLENLERAVRKL